MNIHTNIFTCLLICVVLTVSHPFSGNEVLSDEYLESVLKSWKGREDTSRSKTVPVADLQCSLSQAVLDEIHSYQNVVNNIIELYTTGAFKGKTYDLLAEITDTFGPRLTGSQSLTDAIDWIMANSTSEGFIAYNENLTAPHWVRNNESLTLLSPRTTTMNVLALGTSVGTPPEGITAEVLVVSSFDDLAANASKAIDKIVLFDVPFTTYGETVAYRSSGASEAAKVGAVASIIRSVADFSIVSPHTGVQDYDSGVTKIPGAAISIEDATMLHRMQDRGETIILRLYLGADDTFPDTVTKNTIIETPGTEFPEEIVLVSGHLDSWDVGVGAMDDAGGCTISWIAGKALKALGLTTRRTYQTVLFTAEELGIYGGDAFFVAHAQNKDNYQLMMESDFGTFNPRGIEFTGTDEATCIMQEIVLLTALIGTTELVVPADTPDLGAFQLLGVPRGSLNSEADRYFWYHHSNGDRLDIYTPDILDRVAALWTAVSYVAADVSFRIPHDNITSVNNLV